MKYEVGDVVRIVGNETGFPHYEEHVGKIGNIITVIDAERPIYKIDTANDLLWFAEELVLIKKGEVI